MKVELQAGDTITIPEGCKAIVKDGSVVFEKEQKFKDGDILAYKDSLSNTFPFIYKDTDEAGFYIFYVGVDCSENIQLLDDADNRWGNAPLRYATEEEKKLLFDKMKEQGLRWNAEEKIIERIRWRAKYNELYYYLDSGLVISNTVEKDNDIDKYRYDALNYFRTEEQTEEALKRVKKTLKKFHEEIGE